MANYEEFERELITLTLAHMVRGYPTWSSMFSARQHLVRRLVNLLSTARLYIDQTKHAVSSNAPVDFGCTHTQAKETFRVEYDKSVGYRIMEDLRNYIQHRGEATKGISYPSQIEWGQEGEPLWSFRLDLMLDMEALRRDKCFKRRVLQEIELLQPEQRDLILFVRQYVEGLGHAQNQLRKLIEPAVDKADATSDAALTEWQAAGHNTTGLVAANSGHGSTAEERVVVTDNLKKMRVEMVAAHSSFTNLSRRFVSGIRPHDAYPALPTKGRKTDKGLEFKMPGKSEIMRAVREGLYNLEVVKPWTDTEGSKAVKTKLCEIGREFEFKVGAKRNEVEKAYRDFGEWLYDVTWLEYEPKPFPDGLLIDVHLVAECEWGNFERIIEDFEKLLQARAGFRLMIFTGSNQANSEEIAERLADRVREFKGSRAEDAWLLAAWEGSSDDWSFRYFTIEMNAAIPFPLPSED